MAAAIDRVTNTGRFSALEPDKLRGGYYTPEAIAAFLANWAVTENVRQVLEPSAGDGAIVQAARRALGRRGRITAVELLPNEASKIVQKELERTDVVCEDVFSWFLNSRPDGTFDAVLGNPPFIRFQSWPDVYRQRALTLMAEDGLHANRLTNAWVPFVVLATRALREGGRLGLVLPAELLQVTYAGPLREYLMKKFSSLTIVTFRKLIFSGIQQETVLLLGTRKDCTSATMSFHELDQASDLQRPLPRSGKVSADLNHAREKWTQYYLSAKELGLVREIENSSAFPRLGQLAEVDVGIVTGKNEVFVITPSQAAASGLQRFCLPIVGRSAQIPGLQFSRDEWKELEEQDARCYLLQLGPMSRESLPDPARRYIEEAERAGAHTGYKCRVRLPNWWNVPSTWVPDAFLLRQINDGLRIVWNESGATCTDTIHKVRVREHVKASELSASSMNSLTYAFSEIRGRSYGGGVLELEPSEAEQLPFPIPSSQLSISDMDLWSRRKDTEQILDEVDRVVLGQAGLSRSDQSVLREIWRKLYLRRRNRR